MVAGQGQAGLVVSAEECVLGTKVDSNSCMLEPTLDSAGTSPYAHNAGPKKSGEMASVTQFMVTKFKGGFVETVA